MLTRAQRGVSLIELMIGLAIMAIVVMMALPNYTTFIRNTKVKNAAQSIEAGLQLARTEAIRRNRSVRFQMVSDLSGGCAVSGTTVSAPNWIVSLENPAGKCDVAPSEADAPKTIQKWSAAEGASGSGITWSIAVSGMASSLVTFNALGRLSPASATAVAIDVKPTVTGEISCALDGGDIRCLKVTVSNAGQIRVCDPAMTISTDPRYC